VQAFDAVFHSMTSQQPQTGMDEVTFIDFLSYFSAQTDTADSNGARKTSVLDLPEVCTARNANDQAHASPQSIGLDQAPSPARIEELEFEVGCLVQLAHHVLRSGQLHRHAGGEVLLIVGGVERGEADGNGTGIASVSYILKIPGKSGEGFRLSGSDVSNLSRFTQYASEGSDTEVQIEVQAPASVAKTDTDVGNENESSHDVSLSEQMMAEISAPSAPMQPIPPPTQQERPGKHDRWPQPRLPLSAVDQGTHVDQEKIQVSLSGCILQPLFYISLLHLDCVRRREF
jgi:hypothetical protein